MILFSSHLILIPVLIIISLLLKCIVLSNDFFKKSIQISNFNDNFYEFNFKIFILFKKLILWIFNSILLNVGPKSLIHAEKSKTKLLIIFFIFCLGINSCLCNTRIYKEHSISSNISAQGIAYLGNDQFMTCGFSVNAKNEYRAYISKFDTSVNLAFLKEFTNIKDEKCFTITSSSDEYAYLATAEYSTGPTAVVYKIDATGNIIWRLKINTNVIEPHDIIIGSMSKIAIVGDGGTGGRCVCHINDRPTPTFSCNWLNSASGMGITVTPSGNYAITGTLNNKVHFHTYNPTTFSQIGFKSFEISPNPTHGLAITAHPNGNLFIVGYEQATTNRAIIVVASESGNLKYFQISSYPSSKIFDVTVLKSGYLAYAETREYSGKQYSIVQITTPDLATIFMSTISCGTLCEFASIAPRPIDLSFAASGRGIDSQGKSFQFSIFISGCEPGNYYDETSCKACPEGQYQNLAVSTSCKICNAGNYIVDSTKCLQCAVGYYQDVPGKPSCNQCPEGFYQDGFGQASCKSCQIGQYQPNPGKSLCLYCPPGFYQDLIEQNSCKDCDPGSYQDVGGQSKCKPCPPGKYQDLSRQISCVDCPVGYYMSASGAAKCLECTPGTHQSKKGAIDCEDCSSGYFQNLNGQQYCIQCSEGFYSDTSKATECKKCPAGSYTNQKGQAKCTLCSKGTYQSQAGQTGCNDCKVGFMTNNDGSTTPTACRPGSAQPLTGQSSCILCTPGYYSSLPARKECSECNVGYYVDVPGATKCKPCEPGTYQNSLGQTKCVPCESGKFQLDYGKANCNGIFYKINLKIA